MLRSIFSGVAGLSTHQIAMDVIGSNIANINTIGYKATRATFEDILSQLLYGATSPYSGQGGSNPMQVGLGSTLGSLDNNFAQGGLETTGRMTDLAIQGAGFFVLSDGEKDYYSRAGNFSFDSQGNLVNSNGLLVQGWMADQYGNIDTNSIPDNVVIPGVSTIPAASTEVVNIGANLNAAVNFDDNGDGIYSYAERDKHTISIDIFDSLGQRHTATIKFIANDGSTVNNNVEWWDYYISITNVDMTAATNAQGASGTLSISAWGTEVAAGRIYFNSEGGLLTGYQDPTVTIDPLNPAKSGQTLLFNLGTFDQIDGITQFASSLSISSTNFLYQDGFEAGSLSSLLIDEYGIITGVFTNSIQRRLAQIMMATFNNSQGLIKIGQNVFAESANSGAPALGVAGTGGRGSLAPTTLEMSNVDLAQELTAMIRMERGFQANSRIITTGDEMLQELLTLKR